MTGTGLQKILMIGAVVLSLVLIAVTAELFKQYKESTACNDIEKQFGQVEASWNKGELLILMRHTEKCSAVENACPPGDEGITETGRAQAKLIGDGLRGLGTINAEPNAEQNAGLNAELNAEVFYSPALRTTQTAKTAFNGDMQPLASLVEGCKSNWLEKIKSFKNPGSNLILVTHSSCLNALSDEDQDRILDFNAGSDRFYGLSVFLRQNEMGRIEKLGCMLPSQWQEI
jgi:phosphohistidine phosphatase SixA